MTTVDGGPAAVEGDGPDRAARLEALVSAARAGDDEAFGQLVSEFSPRLWQVARAAGLSISDAEDVVQFAWLRLHEHMGGIRNPLALVGWLTMTARREAWRVREAERKQVPVEQESFTELPDHGPGSEEQVIIKDQHRALWAAFGKLSPRCQALLRIVAFVPRPDYAVIAAALDMKTGSVGPSRLRCLGSLRAILIRDFGEGAR